MADTERAAIIDEGLALRIVLDCDAMSRNGWRTPISGYEHDLYRAARLLPADS